MKKCGGWAKDQLGEVKTNWPRDVMKPKWWIELRSLRIVSCEVITGVLVVSLGAMGAPEAAELSTQIQGVTKRPGFSLPWPVQVRVMG